jgi:hypothetical protein
MLASLVFQKKTYRQMVLNTDIIQEIAQSIKRHSIKFDQCNKLNMWPAFPKGTTIPFGSELPRVNILFF